MRLSVDYKRVCDWMPWEKCTLLSLKNMLLQVTLLWMMRGQPMFEVLNMTKCNYFIQQTQQLHLHPMPASKNTACGKRFTLKSVPAKQSLSFLPNSRLLMVAGNGCGTVCVALIAGTKQGGIRRVRPIVCDTWWLDVVRPPEQGPYTGPVSIRTRPIT